LNSPWALSNIDDGLKSNISSNLLCPIFVADKSVVRKKVSKILFLAQHRYGC
jgi:hypothetical protein